MQNYVKWRKIGKYYIFTFFFNMNIFIINAPFSFIHVAFYWKVLGEKKLETNFRILHALMGGVTGDQRELE